MGRPKKKRLVRFEPEVTYFEPKRETRFSTRARGSYFKPRGIPLSELEEVKLRVDELEALRLCDFLGADQTEAAKKMKISQSTLQRVLAGARKKVSLALVRGWAIRVKGGDYQMPRGFGRGRGRMDGPFAAGPGGACICTNSKCKHEAPHQVGVPCMRMKCPKCGSPMVRKI